MARRTRLPFPRMLLCALAFLAATPALPYYIIGDSLGVGVGWVAPGSRSLAANSVRISGDTILNQLASVPRGSLAFVSLGTNDAVGNAVNVAVHVDRIVAAAAARDIRLVWIGPPCVFANWDSSAAQLDRNLAEHLRGTGVVYVSMRDASVCDRSVRASDGVHFSTAGYRRMWQLAATAAGLVPETALPDVPIPSPMPNPIRVAGAEAGAVAAYTPVAEPANAGGIEALIAANAVGNVPEPRAAGGASPAPAIEIADVPLPRPRPPMIERITSAAPVPLADPVRQNIATNP